MDFMVWPFIFPLVVIILGLFRKEIGQMLTKGNRTEEDSAATEEALKRLSQIESTLADLRLENAELTRRFETMERQMKANID